MLMSAWGVDIAFAIPFAVAACGALVGLKVTPGISAWVRASNVVSGLLTGGFVAPGLSDWLHLPNLANLFAFAIGLLGMSFIAAVYAGFAKIDIAAIVTGWISRRGG
jgi:precorrin-3B methylase